ncbi:cysteine hydrolase family protein [Candidatus Eisenbacteria bacterium]|uniref:Cysteine hydrolase family protein n=1 Tax=Eiseniibacteriota bacterium TaxID=2212470 RepID=A0ABV6YP46_UNCEI
MAEPSAALLVVDMLNDFVLPGAPLEVPAARAIVPAIRRRIGQAGEAGMPVLFLCDAHAEDDPEFKIWPMHAVRGTDGAAIVDELKPRVEDLVVEKTTYSAFHGTRLEEALNEIGARHLIITGILTNICVFFTAADAVMRGFGVEVARDSVAALTRDENDFALDQMAKVLKVEII